MTHQDLPFSLTGAADVGMRTRTPAAALLPTPVIRILFVIDGRIELHKEVDLFGLGYVLDILRANWSPAVCFEVHIATRERAIDEFSRGGHTVDYVGFRFTQADFQINNYQQIWFFADQPSQADGGDQTTDDHILPPYTLEDAELKCLAEWMDRGGGVFATGDHGVLGASLCSRIPRVGTMRRWTRSQGVPSVAGDRRNHTLQGGTDDFGLEGDTLLQEVELVYWQSTHALPFLRFNRVHPLMCSPIGAIDRFPDHMHEGELVPDEQVELDRPLNIPGYGRPEYPNARPSVLAQLAGGASDVLPRPTPRIVAYGQTTNPVVISDHLDPDLVQPAAFLARRLGSKRFGLVSAYDGHAAGIGRVVCDSTWHHWLSVNVRGIAGQPGSTDYRKMQAYYRNVGLWLAGIEQKQAMLVSALWNALTNKSPMAFSDRTTAWEVGERATELLREDFGPCWTNELSASFMDLSGLYAAKTLTGKDSLNPDWSAVPEDLVNRAIIGSICKALREPARQARFPSVKGRPLKVDPEELRKLAVQGASEAGPLILQSLDDAVARLNTLRDSLRGEPRPASNT
jgi:hypothetical protein